MDTDLKSITEAAELLGTSRQNVWKHFKTGKLPNAKKVGVSIIIPAGDIEALAEYLHGRTFRKAGA